MKIVKLTVVFAVIAAAIYGILYISGNVGAGEKTDEPLDGTVAEQCDLISEAWGRQNGWSKKLYEYHRDEINQNNGMGIYKNESEYRTVYNRLIETATNAACDSYNSALKASTFNHNNLVNAYNGVCEVCSLEGLDGDGRVKGVKEKHDLYSKVHNFVGSSHAISPKFDRERHTWTSFRNHQAGVLGTASSYRNHKLFGEIKHIPGFVDGLDESKLKSQTDKYYSSFYDNLSQQIVDCFSGLERTPENQRDLDRVYEKYTDETSHEAGTNRIANLLVNYVPTPTTGTY